MYPAIRYARELWIHRAAPPLGIGETHVTHVTCWPWDIDLWRELNNGRTLTLMDLGRAVLYRRTGFIAAMRARGWSAAVAGVSVRYRRRVRMFDRLKLRSRILGWDDRFAYAEQGLWRQGECCSHALLRVAITGGKGIVPPAELARELGFPEEGPPLPPWVTAWAEAEARRPWPPMQG